MSQPKNRFVQARDLIDQLFDTCPHSDKGLWLASNLGLLEGILARYAAADWMLYQELEERLAQAKAEPRGKRKR